MKGAASTDPCDTGKKGEGELCARGWVSSHNDLAGERDQNLSGKERTRFVKKVGTFLQEIRLFFDRPTEFNLRRKEKRQRRRFVSNEKRVGGP